MVIKEPIHSVHAVYIVFCKYNYNTQKLFFSQVTNNNLSCLLYNYIL